jgi:hypothetical protein
MQINEKKDEDDEEEATLIEYNSLNPQIYDKKIKGETFNEKRQSLTDPDNQNTNFSTNIHSEKVVIYSFIFRTIITERMIVLSSKKSVM